MNQPTLRWEVVGRGALFAGEVETDGEYDNEVNRNNCYVYPGQCFVGEVRRGFAHTPPSPFEWGQMPCAMLVHSAHPGNRERHKVVDNVRAAMFFHILVRRTGK
jgi:hypothetical protein